MNDFTEFAPATRMDVDSLRTQGFGMVQYGPGDDRKIVLFYNKAVPNPRKSQEQGRPVNENQIYVKIGEPGETNLNMIDRPARDDDKRRWPHHWQRFLNAQEQVPEGTPVEMLFPTNPALAASLKSYGIHTIEQLSHLSAEGISRVGMGAQDWVNKAKAYLDKATKGVSFHTHQRDLEERDTRIRVMEDQISQLRAQLDAVLSKQQAAMPVAHAPDVQTMMIDNVQERDFTLPATAFDNTISQPKRRGRPPKNQEN